MCFVLFNDTATAEIYTYVHALSLHDALPICRQRLHLPVGVGVRRAGTGVLRRDPHLARLALVRERRQPGRVVGAGALRAGDALSTRLPVGLLVVERETGARALLLEQGDARVAPARGVARGEIGREHD